MMSGGENQMNYVPPVIVLPGVTGSYLQDEYQMPPDVVWGLLKKDYVRVALHPDNPRYEALEPARVQASGIFEIAYKELIQELRYNLREKEDQPVPVYPFAYDWRQPLEAIEAQLADFVEEVIERTKLLSNYANTDFVDAPKVNLVGHSMGGLIITGYLESKGKAARVAKVVTMGTPYHGSFEAVIKIATGTANLGSLESSSREREAARLTPSLYYLLPSIESDLLIESDSLPKNLFNASLWQRGVVESIQEFVRLQTNTKAELRQQMAQDLFTGFLNAAQKHRARMDNFKLSKAGLQAKDWLCIAGGNCVTRVQLKVTSSRQGPLFDLGSDARKNEWESTEANAKRLLTGDGTVPLESAIPAFLKSENVVCVTPDDFGYWEVQDKLTSKVAGLHAILANMDMLHRLTVRHFKGQADPRGITWGRPIPGVAKWDPPLDLRNKEE